MNRSSRGFSIIESLCMLVAIIVFAMVCVAIYRKKPDFFGANLQNTQAIAASWHHLTDSSVVL